MNESRSTVDLPPLAGEVPSTKCEAKGAVGRWQATFALLMINALLAACSSPCERVAQQRLEFERRAPGTGHSLELVVPFRLVNRLLAEEAERMRPVPLPIPGLDALGSAAKGFRVRLHSLALEAAPPGLVGLRAEVAFQHQKLDLAMLRIKARLTPTYDRQKHLLVLQLKGTDLQEVRPSLPIGAERRIARLMRARLPVVIGRLVTEKKVAKMMRPAIELLTDNFDQVLRKGLLKRFEHLGSLQLRLGDWPISDLKVDSMKGANPGLRVRAALDLPGAGGLTSGSTPRRSDRIRLRLSGAAVAALGNMAISQGRIPGRFDEKGRPSKSGVFLAGFSWRVGERPLKLHLWKTTETCLSLLIGGTPELKLKDNRMHLQVSDGKLEAADGPMLVGPALWLKGTWQRVFRFGQAVAARMRMKLAGQGFRLRVIDTQVDRSAWTLELKVSPDRP